MVVQELVILLTSAYQGLIGKKSETCSHNTFIVICATPENRIIESQFEKNTKI